MFESVIDRRGPARLLGKGAVASIAMHAALLGGVIYVSGKTVDQAVELGRTVTFFDAPAPPPPPPPAGASAVQREHKPKKKPQKDKLVQAEKPVEPTPDPEPTPEPAAAEPEGQPGGVPGGVAGGVVGGTVGGQLGGTLGGTGKGGGTQVLPFGPGMSRPTLVQQKEVVYTREAIAAKVTGLMLVKCVITKEGKLENCRPIKTLPHLEQAVLSSLKDWRYTPITFQGHPVSVDYVIPVRVTPP